MNAPVATGERVRGPGRPRASLGTALAGRLYGAFPSTAESLGWPSAKYEKDPVSFAYDILGIECWDKQAELLTLAANHSRVACASGHKVSKSCSAAIIALWEYTQHEDSRVVLTAPTARQVDSILWREIRRLFSRSGRCVDCARDNPKGPRPCPHSQVIDGEIGQLARTGLKSGLREIVGFTARDAEAVAGISSPHLRYIVDEASGIGEDIYEAIEGNRAGGAEILLISNPTRTEGEFYEAFHGKAEFYETIQISSEETPNAKTGRKVIPGLATRDYIEEKRREWGENSPLYKVRIKGEFVKGEDGKIISIALLTEAECRWKETKASGRLHIGIDPAGPGEGGDESGFAARRGNKHLSLQAFTGLTPEAHLTRTIELLQRLRYKRDTLPVVTIDAEGPVGYRVYLTLQAYAEKNPGQFQLVRFRGSSQWKNPHRLYDRDRDLIWANMADWLRDGGTLIADTKLAQELHAPEWYQDTNSRMKATDKKQLRKELGRSPDRGDAMCLAVWEPAWIRDAGQAEVAEEVQEQDDSALENFTQDDLEFWCSGRD